MPTASVLVSVPFRGLCSEMCGASKGGFQVVVEFPSPFGVCVLKFVLHNIRDTEDILSFRPLSGFVF